MDSLDPIVFRELALVQKIIQDETWLEGERRHCFVSSTDRVVRANACAVILRVGAHMRQAVRHEIDNVRNRENAA